MTTLSICLMLAALACCEAQIFIDKIRMSRTEGMPWPMPQRMELGNKLRVKRDDFTFRTDFYCDIIENAIGYYRNVLFARLGNWNDNSVHDELLQDEEPALRELHIVIHTPCPVGNAQWNMKEHYNLSISENGKSVLEAFEAWGALRGLETFSQLIIRPKQAGAEKDNGLQISTCNISDWPRFSYRGILLDTSRHFIPVPLIQTNLELMAQNKFNVFHWHIVDDQSFPFQSKVYQELHERGAYSPNHVYTQEDIEEIIRHARLWGIRVVVEFDTPSHMMSWGEGIPGLLINCSSEDTDNGLRNTGTLNPIDDSTFDFLAALFQEVFAIFKDKQVHLGGDEVDFPCWSSDPDVRRFMQQMNFTNVEEINNFYFNHLFKILRRFDPNRQFIFWEEVYDDHVTLPPDAIVQVWKQNHKQKLEQLTKNRVLTLLSSCWYLNYISYGTDWNQFYTCDPHDFSGTEEQKKFILGGTACMWAEYVDGTNLIPRLWPRASAVAERLWSDASVNSTDSAAPRLEEQRCRMLFRNYQVEPVNGPGYCYEVAGY